MSLLVPIKPKNTRLHICLLRKISEQDITTPLWFPGSASVTLYLIIYLRSILEIPYQTFLNRCHRLRLLSFLFEPLRHWQGMSSTEIRTYFSKHSSCTKCEFKILYQVFETSLPLVFPYIHHYIHITTTYSLFLVQCYILCLSTISEKFWLRQQ